MKKLFFMAAIMIVAALPFGSTQAAPIIQPIYSQR